MDIFALVQLGLGDHGEPVAELQQGKVRLQRAEGPLAEDQGRLRELLPPYRLDYDGR